MEDPRRPVPQVVVLLLAAATAIAVVRGGRERQIEASELAPGDVFVVESGQSVPADGRILEAAELRTGEAPLTGDAARLAGTFAFMTLALNTDAAEKGG